MGKERYDYQTLRRGILVPHASGGPLRIGCRRVEITPPVGGSFSGFSIISLKASTKVEEPLFATAMVIDDGDQRIALVAVDLLAGTRYITEHVAAQVAQDGVDLTRLHLVASHTHFAPGGIFGDSVYDRSASSATGFDQAVADFIVARLVRVIREANDRLRPARLGVGETTLWGYTANRSLPAFRASWLPNPHAFAAQFEGYDDVATKPWVDNHYAVDPRIRVLWAQTPDGTPIGAIATVAAHSAAQDPLRGVMTAGAMGIAAQVAMREVAARALAWGAPPACDFVVGVAVSNAGDTNIFDPEVTAMPEESRGTAMARTAWEVAEAQDDDLADGPTGATALMPRRLGRVFGAAIVTACERARTQLEDTVALSPLCAHVDPRDDQRLAAHPTVGRVSLGASEYGRFFLEKLIRHPLGRFKVTRIRLAAAAALRKTEPARRGDTGPLGGCEDVKVQIPADDTLHHSTVQEVIARWRLKDRDGDGEVDNLRKRDRAAHHPKCRVFAGDKLKFMTGDYPKQLALRVTKLNDTLWIVSVPFEVTVAMGQAIEHRLNKDRRAAHLPDRRILLFSVAGAYASYVTTEEEYDVQCYEGASTAWGRHQGTWLLEELEALALDPAARCNEDDETTFRLIRFTDV